MHDLASFAPARLVDSPKWAQPPQGVSPLAMPEFMLHYNAGASSEWRPASFFT